MTHNLNEATANVEQIKKGMANYINDVMTGAGVESCSIRVGRIKIDNVVAAKPYNKHSISGIQPYVDLEFILANGNSVFVAVRQRAENPFSRGLGRFAIPAIERGMWSLEKIYPNIRRDFISSLLKHYTQKGFGHKSVLDQAYGVISDRSMREKILIGSPDLGGKCDYVFAIERPSFWYKGIALPKASFGYKGGRFTITFAKTTGFSAQDILAKNEVYLWIPGTQGHTLYLATDMVDKANLPIIVGPPAGKNKPFLSKIKVGLNRAKKGRDVFQIQDNERFFKLELKSKLELETPSEPKNLPPAQDEPISSRREFGRGHRGRDEDVHSINDLIKKHDLDYDDREEIISHIMELAKKGLKHAYQIDLDDSVYEGVEETLAAHLEQEDDRTLQRYASEKPHRLATEFQRKYFE